MIRVANFGTSDPPSQSGPGSGSGYQPEPQLSDVSASELPIQNPFQVVGTVQNLNHSTDLLLFCLMNKGLKVGLG